MIRYGKNSLLMQRIKIRYGTLIDKESSDKYLRKKRNIFTIIQHYLKIQLKLFIISFGYDLKDHFLFFQRE